VPSNWPEVTVTEVCQQIIDCVNKTAPIVTGPTSYKMIRTTNVRGGWVDTRNVKYVNDDVYRKWTRRGKPRPGDIILTREAPLGEVGMLRSSESVFLGQRLVMYRADPSKLDNRFLLYSMLDAFVQNQISALGSGATVEHMRVPDCERLRLRLPPLPTQQTIASVLSAYDELIENNRRRIQILEQMSQTIYREWFIRFRYPGHDAVPLVSSALGPIPEGWEVSRVDEAAQIFRGRSYRRDEIPQSGGVPFLNLKCINRGGGFRKSGLKRYTGPYKPAHEVRPGDIVIAVTDMTQERNIVARVARVPSLPEEFGVISMDLAKIIPTTIRNLYLYGVLRYSQFSEVVKNFANGANVLHLHPDRIAEYCFVRAPKDLQLRYAEAVDPMYNLADRLDLQTENLRAARDLLLPRLISGEIDVSNIDIDAENATA
jgi:type I restriction enzyme S subunit